jgi:hypothetical protein
MYKNTFIINLYKLNKKKQTKKDDKETKIQFLKIKRKQIVVYEKENISRKK